MKENEMTVDLIEYLKNNEYPGRGIAIGRTPCGRNIRIAYWIMGRSSNSRNRVFTETEDGIKTEAFDPAKLEDPSLIIYHPVRKLGKQTIVTNGDQTDTIWNALKEGKTFEDALRSRTFEPDAPNWTPRISALVEGAGYKMSILKSLNPEGSAVGRYFFEYPEEENGFGHLITTYKTNGNPIPSFEGEPIKWEMVHEKFDLWAPHVWEALNEDNKVSLYTCHMNIETGETQVQIFNKNK